MADVNIDGIVTWLKGWFYDKSDVDTIANSKANLNQGQANKNVVTNGSGEITVEDKPVIPTDVSNLTDSTGIIPTDVSDLTDTNNTKFTPKSHTHGNITNDGKISSARNHFVVTNTSNVITSKAKIGDITIDGIYDNIYPYTFAQDNQGVDRLLMTDASDSDKIHACEEIPTYVLKDPNAHPNIGTNARANQSTINSAIDTAISNLSSIQAIQIVSTLPTASSSTMGKLYIIEEDSKVNVYYTEPRGSSFAWRKMDTDILDELSIDWSDVENKPSSFTPSSHHHGNINDDGSMFVTPFIGQSSSTNIPLIRDSSDGLIKIGRIHGTLVQDTNGHSNIGSSANATQSVINTSIDTALGNKGALTDDIDWTYSSNGFTNGVKLVPKTDNANGRITLHLKS